MCGIGALSRAENSSISNAAEALADMAIGLQERGWDATGFGWIGRDAWPHSWKLDQPALFAANKAPLPLGIQTAIVHTRWATQGSPTNPENNHPVVAPGIVLVHNGVLSNDDELFALLECERRGQVDSEALAALLSYGPDAIGETPTEELLQLVEGDAAIAWLDGDTPETLHLARLSHRPMELGWTKRGDLLMASTAMALQAASNKKFGIVRRRTVEEGTYLQVVRGEIVDERRIQLPRKSYTVPAGRTYVQTVTHPRPGVTSYSYSVPTENTATQTWLENRRAEEEARLSSRPKVTTTEFGRSKETVIALPRRSAHSYAADEMIDPFDDDALDAYDRANGHDDADVVALYA